jgi:hypothetical protein
MKTFEIRGGDLVLGAGGFASITGAVKVKQDMAVAVREPFGVDRFHPLWGTVMEQFVGSTDTELVEGQIRSEVYRLVRNYVGTQSEQIRADTLAGRKPRYGTDELVSDIKALDIRQEFDRLYLRVTLSTNSGDQVTLTSTMGI